MIGEAPWAGAAPGERTSAEAAWRRQTATGEPVRLVFHITAPSGSIVAVRLDAHPTPAGSYLGTVLDDSEADTRAQLLDRLVGVAGAVSTALVLFDRDDRPVFANRAAAALFGFEATADALGDPTADPHSHAVLDAVRDQVPRHVLHDAETAVWSGEVGVRSPDGLERTLHVELLAHRVEGVSDYWALTARDVTDSKRVHTELTRQATHDAHTGLPNRVHLLRLAAGALERSRQTRGDVAIVFIDIDRLKEVNDTVGHDAGDVLIAQVAERLVHAIRPTDVVGRLGGDEFAVLCEGEIDDHVALEIAERLRRALSGRFVTRGAEITIGASVGVAVANSGSFSGASAADAALALLRQADVAMYLSKRRERGRAELYTDDLRTGVEASRRLANELEQALPAGQLFVVYQPVVAVHSGRTVGAEALLRWRHPERGVLPPAEFVTLAEDSGAIVPIGDWVVRTACSDTRAWLDAGLFERTFRMHVNVAARQLGESTFVERVRSSLQHADLAPQQLTLDASEPAFAGAGRRTLLALRREGVHVALDGFGAGTSSLTTLRSSKADIVKLDGKITEALQTGDGEDPLVRSIVQLAHALDMQVVAQWVRAPRQLERLRVLGCDLAQGDLFGEPASADRFADRARR